MKKIVIIGGGFGGLSAAFKLAPKSSLLEVTVIDPRKDFTFLPLLPDLIGREISPEHLTYPIAKIAEKFGFHHLPARVNKIDLDQKKVVADKNEIDYDYLMIAAGSETNFYGNKEVEQNALKLDDAADGVRIHAAVLSGKYDTFIVSGGGYTGMEAATNLKLLLKKKKLDKKVMVVEIGPALLGPLPQWMKDFVMRQLEKLGIEYFVKTSIKQIAGDKISLSDGREVGRALLIWSAGVKTPAAVSALAVEKTRQGRLAVDEYLRIRENCFAVGDCAASGNLRMAARFSIQQGRVAAQNILRNIRGKKLKKYRSFDWGYFVPLANNTACGITLGMNLKGFIGILGHYFLCFWLSYGLRNRFGLIRDLLTK
jgi:NADH dehydrogenase